LLEILLIPLVIVIMNSKFSKHYSGVQSTSLFTSAVPCQRGWVVHKY